MKIAVTGATGFLGRHVVRALTELSVEPVIVCRSVREPSPYDRGLHTAIFDIASPPQDAFAQMGKPNAVIHLAWGGLPNYRSPHHFASELPAHFAFLRGLVEQGATHLVVAGTCLEYGMQSGQLSEDLAPQPTTPYGHAKDALRRQLQFLQQSAPFALTWARFFYMYGEGQGAASLYSQLRAAAARGDQKFPMSQGEQLRDYLPVEDAARAMSRLAVAGDNHGVVNVCSGQPTSVRRLVESWIASHGWSIRPDLGRYPYPDYEPLAFWGDRSKLEACLPSR